MPGKKRYWKPVPEGRPGGDSGRREGDGAGHSRFPAPMRLSRRGFLKAAGFALPAGMAACSRAPVEKVIPFLVQPESIVPGRSLWYASTCRACEAACGVLVKSRDGRPIKLEGNREHPLSRGGLCARGQADVIELYDERRLRAPRWGNREAGWDDVDRDIASRLDRIRTGGGAIRFLTGTVVSPTRNRVIDSFLAGFSDARHVSYDAISHSAILEAHHVTHGVRALPRYRLDSTDVIVSLDADFLGSWIAPVEYTAAWQERRRPTPQAPRMSYHVQIESRLSVTGSKADRRWAVRPSLLVAVAERLLRAVSRRAGDSVSSMTGAAAPVSEVEIEALADRLWRARRRSVVLCGVNDVGLQLITNRLNHLLGAYGTTIDIERPSRQATGDDRGLFTLLDELDRKQVAALLVAGANPAYDLVAAPGIADRLKAVPLLISFARVEDETSRLAKFVCPDHHPLESWGDAEPVAGVASLVQPAIRPLAQTRAVIETLARWSGSPQTARALVRETWRREIYPRSGGRSKFEDFWDRALERGVVDVDIPAASVRAFSMPKTDRLDRQVADPGMDLVLYASLAMGDGRQANNPWLHELPEPIAKVTWDNFASLSPADASRLHVAEGDVVRIEVPAVGGGQRAIEVPVFVQPGQAGGTVAVALGYGRSGSERFRTIGPRWIQAGNDESGPIGANAAALLDVDPAGRRRFWRSDARIVPTGRHHPLACTQTHHTMDVPERLAIPGAERRDVIRAVSLAELRKSEHGSASAEATLWPDDHPYSGHHWALAVDLNACTGCSACLIGCQAENNIPVVGRDEVRRRRDMHWLRIDTYYSGEGSDVEVAHQPMMCQQCDNAPCETVCPVLATVHSKEGLNEQVYNRCVGTRYCANNCPYKVRRFNWFNYHKQRRRQDLVLNPDVTVRSRGVMEKCTFCAQRIAAGKIEARAGGRDLVDGAIQTACEQSCPARAIVFGDLNDPKSRVARLMASARRYRVLEELGVRPSVGYLAVVRHGDAGEEEASHA